MIIINIQSHPNQMELCGMAYQIEARTQDGHPYLEIRDIDSGAVRLAWRHPAPDQTLPDDPIVRALVAEEALHHLFKRLFLLAAGQQASRRRTAAPPSASVDQAGSSRAPDWN
jgi:hypothetical protein